MRSEKEIRNRLKKLQKLAKREANDINRMIKNNDRDFLKITIDRANMYQSEINVLKWVLREIN